MTAPIISKLNKLSGAFLIDNNETLELKSKLDAKFVVSSSVGVKLITLKLLGINPRLSK